MPNDEANPAEANEQSNTKLIATAYHEAGHAVMAMQLGRTLQKVTIVPGQIQTGGVRLGVCQIQKGRAKVSKDWMEDDALILFAGMVAEAQFTGEYCRQGAGQDLRMIRGLLQQRAKSERQVEKLERRLLDKTSHLLSDEQNAKAVELVARELIQKQTVSGRAVRHFIEEAERHCS
jgi:ATP-dependent Zn protease